MYSRPGTRKQEYTALFSGRYGPPPPPAPPPATTAGRSVQMTVDTGQELLERPVEPPEEEYVVDRPEPPAAPPAPPEPPPAPTTPLPAPAPPAPVEPPQGGPTPLPVEPTPRPEMPEPPTTTPSASGTGSETPEPLTPTASARGTALPPPSAPSPGAPVGGAGLTSADLAADMQAILGGGLVYDQSIGKVRPRSDTDPVPGSGAASVPAAASGPSPETPGELPLPDVANEQSIFDRIRRSMEHANSFDLGTHELHRPFARLEQRDQQRRTATATPMAVSTAPAPARSAPVAPPPTPATPEPVAGLRAEDFAAVYQQRVPGRNPGCAGSGATAALAPRTDDQRSVPMYDTGEHVQSGGDLFVDRLVVGRAPGVAFSYGQIIAMPDFYGTVDDLLAADPAELNRLKTLIARNTAYYVGGKADASGNISNEQWDTATGDRYMRLAEVNYDHFAPAALLGLPGTQTRSDHRQRWEELHRRALTEMQQLVLAHPNASPFPMGPLTVNAFADHFLTDAFAAGHLVNKEVLMDRFKSRFFSGSALTADAGRFFDQVADRAWTSRVQNAMKHLEPTSPPDALCVHGLCAPILPNIRTSGMFAEVLKQAAVAEKDKIANLAVKVLHDKFNTEGVDVVNDAGDAWHVTGDGHLTRDTLVIMRRAVDQSAANIDDPSILASNANFDPLVARVWRFTPRPTPAARVVLTRAVDTYTDPRSADFVAATATLIDEQITMLVDALVDSGRMQRGGGI